MIKKYKLSNYAIVSDSVNETGDRVVLSGWTGKVMIVSAYCLECILNERIHEIPQEELNKLIEVKILVLEDDNELVAVIRENQKKIKNNKSFLYEVLQPSANCQLGCHYCGQQHVKSEMKSDLITLICERIINKVESGGYKGLFIAWFGAEPLMGLKQIREITKILKGYCKEKGIPYKAKMVTNGLSLKENIFVEAATELSVKQFEITLDGVAEFHDDKRFIKGGAKSFDLIFRNLKKILLRDDFFNLGAKVSIRCNVDSSNEESVSPLINLLAKEGLHKRISNFYTMKIFNWGGNDASSKTSTKEDFAKLEMSWRLEMLDKGYRRLTGLPSRRPIVCMSLKNDSELIDAYGNVYNCTEVSYSNYYKNSHHVLGNLQKDGVDKKYENPPLSEWNNILLTNTFPCTTCKILPLCGGQCPKKWYENEQACPSVKYSIRERLELYYILNKGDVNDDERNSMLLKFKNKMLNHEFEMLPHLNYSRINKLELQEEEVL